MNFERVKSNANQAIVDFLKIELSLALTFADLAFTTSDPGTRDRNTANAKKAYETVSAKLPKIELSAAEAAQVQKGLERLKSALRSLGENL